MLKYNDKTRAKKNKPAVKVSTSFILKSQPVSRSAKYLV